jgi:hypothetical protein
MEGELNISQVDFNISDEETKRRVMILKDNAEPCSIDLYQQQIIQKRIREQSEILFPEKFGKNIRKDISYRRKPNLFYLQICIISEITPNSENKDLLKNIDIRHIASNMSEEDHAQFEDEQFNCACGQPISSGNIWMVINIITGKWIHAGCECITKHELATAEEMRIKKKEVSAKKRQLKKEKKEKEKLEREILERELEEQRRQELERIDQEKYQTRLKFRNMLTELMKHIREEQERQRQEQERQRQEQEQRRREEEEIQRIEQLKQKYRQCKTCKFYNVEKTKPSYYYPDCVPCYILKQKLKQPKKKCRCGNEISNSKHNLCYYCYKNQYKNQKIRDDDDYEFFGHS